MGFWTSFLSAIIFSFWPNKKTVYQALRNTMPNLFYTYILGTILLILPNEAYFFVFMGLAFWMLHLRNAEHMNKKKVAFILVNLICIYLVIVGISIAEISDIGTLIVTFLVLVFYLFSTHKMYPNDTIAKYNKITVFFSFLVYLWSYVYVVVFRETLRIDPVATTDAFSIFIIIPTLVLTYGYYGKKSNDNPAILTKKDTVLLWLLTFGVPIIGYVICTVTLGLAGLGS